MESYRIWFKFKCAESDQILPSKRYKYNNSPSLLKDWLGFFPFKMVPKSAKSLHYKMANELVCGPPGKKIIKSVKHNGGEEPPQDAIHSPFIIDINKRQRHAKGGQDKGVVLLATGR